MAADKNLLKTNLGHQLKYQELRIYYCFKRVKKPENPASKAQQVKKKKTQANLYDSTIALGRNASHALFYFELGISYIF